ncbi:hypothetical protein [Cellulosimicrobium sp. CpK407]|uniref:hypothetical protein n=1 Tax=Cellulosimicrobium sp. CpK407 TaxID=3229847 RepID=UPI003F2A300C
MATIPVLPVGKVFVPGGKPTVTYVPREELNLERRIDDFLAERGKVLSISGPTKTGKTVLLRSRIQDAIWLSGGTISSASEFWEVLADELGLYTDTTTTGELSHTETVSGSGGLSAGVASAQLAGSDDTTRSHSQSWTRQRAPRSVAREHIRTDPWSVTVVIDDFHYVPAPVQLEIIRSLKDLVFDGMALIVVAVPHRAYDVVRVEKEMTGRVAQLEVGFWDQADLRQISERGFTALNVQDVDKITDRLAAEAFQSPHLMQEFCREICKLAGVSVTASSIVELASPEWQQFFSRLAPDTSKAAFDLLARGPRQRSDRKPRRLAGGGETDIYGAVLRGIAKTGPLTALTYEQLRGSLREVLADDPPQRHEITRVLEEMAKIAREQIEGEPVVDYDNELATLYISDPYFAYWLRWGTHNS